jgi:hypothetical protein
MLHYTLVFLALQQYYQSIDTNFIEGSKAKKVEKPMRHVAKKLEATIQNTLSLSRQGGMLKNGMKINLYNGLRTDTIFRKFKSLAYHALELKLII